MRVGITTSVIRHGESAEASYVLGLVRALAEARAPYEFVLFVLENDLPLFDFAGQAMRLVAVSEDYRPAAKDFAWHQFVLPNLVRQLEIDVLHVPTQRRMLWRRPCRLVATVHDFAPFHFAPIEPGRDLARRELLRQLARRQDELVAVSRVTAQDIACFAGAPAAHVTVIRSGVDQRRFTPGGRDEAAAEIARRHRIQPPFFLCVSPLDYPAKNHLRLIQAFAQFKMQAPSPWQLVLLGAPGPAAAAIHEASRRSGYAQDIHCPGAASWDELPAWYRAAGALVHPVLVEGFAAPALEAMASGCPVLAPSASAVAELCGGAALFADPEDCSDLQQQLSHLAFDAGLRARLRDSGLQHVRRFDWARTASAMLDVYARAAHRIEDPLAAAAAFAHPLS